MDTNEKPHRRYGNGYGLVFWNDNTASDEDGATRVVVYCGPPGMPYPEFEFKWPEQKFDVEKLERALQKAFQRGVAAAKEEIRNVLGVPAR